MNPDMTQCVESLRSVLKSQYHAALATLRQAIDACPDDLWVSEEFPKPYWRVAYHTLFYAHFYLQPNVAAFVAWERHQGDIHSLDARPIPDNFPGLQDLQALPKSPLQSEIPYSKGEILTYWDLCDGMIDAGVDQLDVLSSESGFSWYRVPKIEHQIVNIRHIQHHAAQLAERLRCATDVRLEWVGAKPSGK